MTLNKAFFTMLFLYGGGLVNIANADSLSSSVVECSEKVDNTERLNCFDRLSSQLKKTLADNTPRAVVRSVPEIAAAPVVDAPEAPSVVAGFGLPDKPEPVDEVTMIQAVATEIARDPFKKLLISLDLNQVWQQIDDARMRVREGDHIVLERGALGSFLLGVQGKSKRMRVKRIK